MVRILKKIRTGIKKDIVAVLRKFGYRSGNWKDNLPHETLFWARALEDPNNNWKIQEYEDRTNPRLGLQEDLKKLINFSGGSPIRILDVGAGPLTRLGKVCQGHVLEIVAVDPLASAYDQILEKIHLKPLVRTVFGEGEKLNEVFPRDSFDLAYSSNALDHSYDPFQAIENMVNLVKPGASVYLWHFRNEGKAEHYQGLHQWNFDIKQGDLVIDDGVKSIRVGESLREKASIACHEERAFNGDVVVAILTKKRI